MANQQMRGSELIISPTGVLYHITLAKSQGLPSKFILVGDPKRADLGATLFDHGKVAGRSENREYVTVWGQYHGEPLAIMGTGIGTDNTEIAVGELHALHEFDHASGLWKKQERPLTLIRVGTAGSPQSDVPLGTLGIGSHAIGLDSTGLHYPHEPLDSERYAKDFDSIFYTPGNDIAKQIYQELQRVMPPMALKVSPQYVSTATPDVIDALVRAANELKRLDQIVGHKKGIGTSAPGFYAPQGRRIGRLNNPLIPDLQSLLAQIRVKGGLSTLGGLIEGDIQAVFNEMESSLLFRLAGEILGYRVGSICSVVANRAEGEYISLDEMNRSILGGLRVALEALVSLD